MATNDAYLIVLFIKIISLKGITNQLFLFTLQTVIFYMINKFSNSLPKKSHLFNIK